MIHITLYIPILYEHIKQIVSYCRFNSQDFPLRRFEFRVLWNSSTFPLKSFMVTTSAESEFPPPIFSVLFFLMRVHYWMLLFAKLWHSQSGIGQRRSSGNKVTLYTDIRTRKRVHRTMTYHKSWISRRSQPDVDIERTLPWMNTDVVTSAHSYSVLKSLRRPLVPRV